MKLLDSFVVSKILGKRNREFPSEDHALLTHIHHLSRETLCSIIMDLRAHAYEGQTLSFSEPLDACVYQGLLVGY